ncbi:MAG: Mu-like prophage major head subunit gpT family protein [Mariprofundus sp.]|nr:Mu-like prophage major head subunit gpT family protein [Mariprofundus sp.]
MANFDLPNIAKLTKGVKLIFNGLQKAPNKKYLDIATEVNTKSHTVDYAWLNNLPAMKKWIGLRNRKRLKDNTYAIVKEDWEATIEVTRDDFLFDRLGLVKTQVQQLNHAVIKHYNKLVHSLISLNGVCFDGQPFFGPHTVGLAANAVIYDNMGTAKLTEAALFDIIAFMQSIKDEEGEELEIEPTILLIAPNLLKQAKTILGAKTIAGTDNIALNMLEMRVVQSMPANAWCVLDTSQPLKPFILQITKPGKIEVDSSKMFDEKLISYGIDTMDNAGYGFWQMAFYSDGSV